MKDRLLPFAMIPGAIYEEGARGVRVPAEVNFQHAVTVFLENGDTTYGSVLNCWDTYVVILIYGTLYSIDFGLNF